MSSSVNNQAPPPPPPPSPAAGADVPRTPDTVATVSDSLSLTNSILIVLIGYLLWKMFGKRIGQSKSSLFCCSISASQHVNTVWGLSFTDLSCPRSMLVLRFASTAWSFLSFSFQLSLFPYWKLFAVVVAKLSSTLLLFLSASFFFYLSTSLFCLLILP